MQTGFLLVLTGSTAGGKDTITSRLLEKFPSFSRVTTTTTRPPRIGEVQGRDYFFIAREEFEQKIKTGEIFEYAEYSGNLYGTTKKELDRLKEGQNLIWVIEPTMAAKVRTLFPKNCLVIYISLSPEETIKRLKNRGFDPETLQRRTQQDTQNWENLKVKFEHVIPNPDGKLQETVEKIANLIPIEPLG